MLDRTWFSGSSKTSLHTEAGFLNIMRSVEEEEVLPIQLGALSPLHCIGGRSRRSASISEIHKETRNAHDTPWCADGPLQLGAASKWMCQDFKPEALRRNFSQPLNQPY